MDIGKFVGQFLASFLLHEAGVHLEVTNLLIPGYNDADEQIAALVGFVAELDRSVPLHFSAYHPAWKLEAPPTPPATIARAMALARTRLDHVYAGNVALGDGSETRCPACGATAIRRCGYATENLMDPGARCPGCGAALPVVV